MIRVMCFVDGFNLYHSIKEMHLKFPGLKERDTRKYKWLDLKRLAEMFVHPAETLTDIFYFSAYAFWKPASFAKHRTYVKALESTGVKAVFSNFREIKPRCNLCHRLYVTHIEKQTDVKMAAYLIEHAVRDAYDKALIITVDSDLAPAVEAVKRLKPEKQIKVVTPVGRSSDLLRSLCDGRMKIKRRHLDLCQLPEDITLSDGSIIHRPVEWV